MGKKKKKLQSLVIVQRGGGGGGRPVRSGAKRYLNKTTRRAPCQRSYIIIFIRTNCQAKQRHICTRRLRQPLVIRDSNRGCAIPSLSWQLATEFWLGTCHIVRFLFFFLSQAYRFKRVFNGFCMDWDMGLFFVFFFLSRASAATIRKAPGFVYSWVPYSPWMIPLWFCFRTSLYFTSVSDIRDQLSFFIKLMRSL